MDKFTQALTLITQGLISGKVAIPVVYGIIAAIAAIVKGATGKGPTATELADLIADQVEANDWAGRAEILRLKELIK